MNLWVARWKQGDAVWRDLTVMNHRENYISQMGGQRHRNVVFVLVCAVIAFAYSHPLSVQQPQDGDYVTTSYTHYEDLQRLFHFLEQKYPRLARTFSIGKSVEGRDLLVLEISENVAQRSPGEPMVKYVANMHGDEPVGRELLIILGQYLLDQYGKDDRITRLVNQTDIYLMPSMNPDGFEKSQVKITFALIATQGMWELMSFI